MSRAFEGPISRRGGLVEKARRDAWRRLPAGTIYEIREALGPGAIGECAVAWVAYHHLSPDLQKRRPASSGFDAITGTFIHERAIVPAACSGCGLEVVVMRDVLVCICCGGGTLSPHEGCRHRVFQFDRITPVAAPSTIPLSCEDVES